MLLEASLIVPVAILQRPSRSLCRNASRRQARRTSIPVRANGDEQIPPQDPSKTPPRPNITDPVQFVEWGGTLPNPRRAVIGGLTGTAIALGGNLFGITSFLLGLDGGKTAGNLRLDALIPVDGFKRCFDSQNGFEFIYPSNWLADQRLYRRYAERIERERSLDPPSLRTARRRVSKYDDKYEPSAAFGPPGSTGEDNISVVVAPIRDGFTLQKMGTPLEAAGRFIESIAPENSGKVGTLLSASERTDPVDGERYYVMEFIIEAPGKFKRHNIAVYGSRNGLLYTFNAQASEARFKKELEGAYRKAANSFKMTNSGASEAGFPDRL